MRKLAQKPRDYQLEAAEYAYIEKRTVCVLPTGSGKTLIGLLWAKRLLEERKVRRILVLEPTRYLVEQTASYYRRVSGLDAQPVHGGFPKWERIERWKAVIVVATPEIVLSDLTDKEIEEIDAIIVDECHHTTGQDSYAKLIRKIKAEYRLGLSAFIPRSRRAEIEKFIGKIKCWSWEDPRIRQYVPEWLGEVYEAPLNNLEMQILKRLEAKYRTVDRKHRSAVKLAIRFFVRDGALALKESLEKKGKLWELVGEDVSELLDKVRPAHKLPALKRILADHEGFRKAIIFIDRVSLAFHLSEKLKEWGFRNVVLCGKSRREKDVKEILKEAYDHSTEVVISTSAGEEGIDLPTADLLIIWSNVVSTLRFIQRHGRLLRKTGGGLKFVTYIATPSTPDMDSLVDAIYLAKKAGVDVPLEEEVFQELVRKSTKARIIDLLENRPLPLEWIAEVLNLSISETRRHLSFLLKNGDIVFFYTHMDKLYVNRSSYPLILEEYDDYFNPKIQESTADVTLQVGRRKKKIRGTLNELELKLEEIVKKEKISKMIVSVQVFNPDLKVYHLVNLTYNYYVDDPALAKLILRNAFAFAEKKVLSQFISSSK